MLLSDRIKITSVGVDRPTYTDLESSYVHAADRLD